MKRSLSIAVSILVLAACAVSSNVTRFHRLTPELRGATFAIEPSAEQFGSPEFAHYATRAAGHLRRYGFVPAPAGEVARLRVEIAHRVGAAETTSYREPIYLPHYSTWNHGLYGGTAFGFPGTGWLFAGYRTVRQTRYPRIFELKIFDRWAPRDRAGIFEARAVNNGLHRDFAEVGDCLIDALFLEFPGTSGNRRAIAVSPAQCK